MAIYHNAMLHLDDIDTANTGARAFGPLAKSESLPLAAYLGMQEKSVREWFQTAGRAGCLRRDFEGKRISEMPKPSPLPAKKKNPTPEQEAAYLEAMAKFKAGQPRKRAMLGVCLGASEGLIRESMPAYKGTREGNLPYEQVNAAETLARALEIVARIYDGDFDQTPGFRLSKAWFSIVIKPRDPLPTDTKPYPWEVVTLYYGFTPGHSGGDDDSDEGDSDPDEPYYEDWPDEEPEFPNEFYDDDDDDQQPTLPGLEDEPTNGQQA